MYFNIIKTGVNHAVTQNESKRIQLLNIYALIWMHFSAVFIVLNIISNPFFLNVISAPAYKTILDLSTHVSAFLLSILIVKLNKINRFNAAKVVFILMAYFVFFILTILAEINSHTIIFFALIPLLVLSLYKEVKVAVVALFICLITSNWIHVFSEGEITTTKIIQNVLFLKDVVITALFVSLFFLLLYFKKTNIKNEELLEKERDKVLSDKIKLEKQEIKLRELNEFKTHFFVNLSHEIRTPITLIKGYSSKFNLEDTKLVNKEKLTVINSQVHQVETIIDNILDLSKLDANELKLERNYTKISSFLKKHYSDFKELFSKKDIVFTITENIPNVFIDMDAILMSKSFNNLLTNALKFTPKKGKVHIDINYSNVLEISVVDNGLGIRSEDIANVFKRFYQSKNHITKSQGSGIGLSFTKSIVDAHGFFITVESSPEVNTEFKIIIPENFIKVNHEIEDNKELPTSITVPQNNIIRQNKTAVKKGKTILVVDDHEQMRSYLKDILFNYNVLEAENGEEALKILKKEKVDLLVTDYMMPVMDGEELVKTLKVNNLKTPIIVLTARVDDSAKLTMLRIGVDGYLIKPFIEEELLLFVKNSLRFYDNIIETEKTLTNQEKESVNGFSADFEKEISDLIVKNLGNQNFGVSDIAEYFEVSTRTLNRKIKMILGQTAQQLMNYIRIKTARELQLKQPYLSQKEIANRVGIKNTTHLFNKIAEQYGSGGAENRSNK